MLTWWNRPASTSLKSLPCAFHCSHTADNTFACDAFLCDVKLAASGLRGTAQDVCERDRARDNKENQSRDHSYGETQIKGHFCGARKARVLKECKQVNVAGNSGKLLKVAPLLLPDYISQLSVACLRLTDAWALWCLIPLRRQRAWSHTDMWYSHTTKPSLHVAQQWFLTGM